MAEVIVVQALEPAAAWAMVNDCIGSRATLVVEAAGEALVSSDGPLEFRVPGAPGGAPTAYRVGGAFFVLPGPYDRAERVRASAPDPAAGHPAALEEGLRFWAGPVCLTLWIRPGEDDRS